jgi:lysophospholipase L1-like esterase
MGHFASIFFCFISLCFCAQNKINFEHYDRYQNENNALTKASIDSNRIILMGNSITESWIKMDSVFFKGKPYINRGISGETTSQMLVRFRPDVIQLHPKAVVILAGINDIAENNGPITLENIFGNIQSMVELAQANHIQVILCSVLPASQFPWRKHLKPADKIIRLNEMIENYCVQNNIHYIDYYSSMVNESKGLKEIYTYDGVHPNQKGYQLMEVMLEKTREEIDHQK